MPSTIRGSDNFDTAGGNAVKAWVNFNGTGTVAIRAAYNVASITDNGTGDYTANFTTALPDANYAVNSTVSFSTTAAGGVFSEVRGTDNQLSTSVRLGCFSGGSPFDVAGFYLAIFR